LPSIEEGIDRFSDIIASARAKTMRNRLTKLKGYLQNNQDCLINYAERYKQGKVTYGLQIKE